MRPPLALGTAVCLLLLTLIPNPWVGRLAFLGCGGMVVFIGFVLVRSSRRAAPSGG